LFKAGEPISAINNQPAEAERDLLGEVDYSSRVIEASGSTYLLLVSSTELNGEPYQLVSSYDITSTYQLFAADFTLVRIVGIASALLVAGLLLLLVRTLLKPLRSLSNTTRQIASGDLDKRATVTGNDEVSEVAVNLNTMADSIEHNVTELEKLAESRRVFIGNLAHEMRTPLTSILGFADILRIKREVSEADRIEYAGVIVNETKRLQGLSSKLMELLAFGSLEASLERIDLVELANELGITLQPVFIRQQIGFDGLLPNQPVYINADRELIKSLLYNLIDNAIKASAPGATVTLAVIPSETSARLQVADEGTGIPADQIPLLTEPFYMLDKARTRKHGGAGLGLALCAEIARVHGTELLFDSEMGRGTSVSVDFPLAGGDG
ncbi:MAG: HAMP domain-containing histidine kinase, partial [Coriobacteriales bacterium]|nr:HAMP domain-containing histidine kinase [Coriobacteriales bacterium]